MIHAARLLPLLALLPCAATAQETPAAALGRTLSAARDSGALARALEERTYLYEKGENKLLIVARGEQLADGAGLWFEMRFENLGRRREKLRERCELAWSGEARRVEVEVEDGRRGGKGSGEVRDGKCELSIQEPDGETTTRSLEWGPEVVSMGVALFLLPALHDQGLPAELKMRLFEGEDLRVNRFSSVLTVAPEATGEEGARLREVSIARREGEAGDLYRALVRAEGEENGRIQRVEVDGITMRPISAEEAEKLRAETAAPEGE